MEDNLDLYIGSPGRFRHWIKLVLRLIARRPKRIDQADQHFGRRVEIRIDGKDHYQLRRRCRRRIHPDGRSAARVLTVCAPAPVAGTPHQ